MNSSGPSLDGVSTCDAKDRFDGLIRNAASLVDPARDEAARTDSTESFPRDTLEAIKTHGFLAAPLPRSEGGLSLSIAEGTNAALLTILKELGRANLVVGRVYEGHVNALQLTYLYGSPEQSAGVARDALGGHLFGVWNTEANDGVRLIPKNNGTYVMQGSKTFATAVDYVTRPIVNGALPDGGWQICLVPLDRVEYSVDRSWWDPMGMRATGSFKVDFTGVELEEADLIGKPQDYYRQPWFSGGSVRFAAVQFGAAEALFDLTREYLNLLGRIDDPYQRARLGEMSILVETGNSWLRSAGDQLDAYMADQSEANGDRFLAYANMMRTAIEKICVEVMRHCQAAVGARGLNRPFHFGRIIRDLMIYLRQPAPDAALSEVGRYVLERDHLLARDIWTSEK